jgi:hypothetical protein
MNKTLVAFEKHIGLGPVATARVLGCAYPTYAQYRSGLRSLPTYHAYHMDALMRLSQIELRKIIQERINGTS